MIVIAGYQNFITSPANVANANSFSFSSTNVRESSYKMKNTLGTSRTNRNDFSALQHNATDNTSDVKLCNSRRLTHLYNECKSWKSSGRRNYHYLYVDEKHKVVLCLPLKAGCTTWKLILANNSREQALDANFKGKKLHSNGLKQYGINRLNTFSKEEQGNILRTFYKVVVVRHPLDRLVSAYNDKFCNFVSERWTRKLGGQILNKYHPELDAQTRRMGKGVLFHEFLNHILTATNPHWRPIHKTCFPCDVTYDYMVKLETQSIDAAHVIGQHFGPHFRGLGSHGNKKGGGAGGTLGGEKLLSHYVNVTDNLLQAVLDHGYRQDMQLFGYDWRREANGSITSFCRSGDCVANYGGGRGG